MESRTIPEDQWVDFFASFSRDHLGWPATIKVLSNETGPQNVADNLAFEGISLDTKGTRPCTIEVGVGDKPDKHISHVIDMPLYVRELEEQDGTVDLQIEPAEGPVTLIRLQGPVS